jgi:hypothetical protein
LYSSDDSIIDGSDYIDGDAVDDTLSAVGMDGKL